MDINILSSAIFLERRNKVILIFLLYHHRHIRRTCSAYIFAALNSILITENNEQGETWMFVERKCNFQNVQNSNFQ
jgi:hypothetical protein